MIRLTNGKALISGWSPTPARVITEALKLADVHSEDVVYDLGCGDGRVVVAASRQFGAHATGFDVSPKRIRQTMRRIKSNLVEHLATARCQDLRQIPDLHNATVIYTYLPQKVLNSLSRRLRRNCAPGTRVLSVQTWIYHWPTDKELALRVNDYEWHVGLWLV
jgi:cyclopropane fatty-acyl-phospholipid synthase-like methyltransferase